MGQPSGEVVLVTGRSSGVGRAICDRLAKGGVTVYGGSRSTCTADLWMYVQLNVTVEDSVSATVDQIVLREGRIDALINPKFPGR